MEDKLNTALLPVLHSGKSLTVSSLDVATGLGLRHKNLLETIRLYEQTIEENFGRVAFQTRPLPTRGGVQNQAVALLTEDQALFIGTLSRNSKRVVAFKVTLVKSFSEARRLIRESIHGPAVAEQQEARIARLERQIGRLIDVQLQAGRSLLELPRSSETLPVETTRMKVQKLVNAYCRNKGVGQQDAWRMIYDRLYYLYRINIRAHSKQTERESWLDVAERKGYMDKIYAIASAELTAEADS